MLREILLILATIRSTTTCSGGSGGQTQVLRARANILRAVPGGNPSGSLGTLTFRQDGARAPVTIRGTINGLTPGLHGFHVHESGNLGNGCNDAGPHYNPGNVVHGGPTSTIRHVGDLGNINTPANGVTTVSITDSIISLTGAQSIVGRAIVIHADPDDLGLGNAPTSNTTGNSGARVACGVIRLI